MSFHKRQDGFIQTTYTPTQLKIADVMKEALGKLQHSSLVNKLGLEEAPTSF